MSKSDREIMEILEAYDLTRCAWTAARLAGCDPKTVSRYVAAQDLGRDPRMRMARPRLAGPCQEKIEEWVERSHGAVRADVVHERLRAMGYDGDERTTRRAVATANQAWVGGRRRTYRPWIPEPGMWLQFDWGKAPEIRGRGTLRFCAWLAWSRYRVIIPTWDRTLETALTCLDGMLRLVGGVASYLLTDNERTVTMDRVAGIPWPLWGPRKLGPDQLAHFSGVMTPPLNRPGFSEGTAPWRMGSRVATVAQIIGCKSPA